VAQGRYSAELARWIVALGEQLGTELDAGNHWWDHRWSRWTPDEEWDGPSLTAGWDTLGR
jgi:hypothetical protein